VVRALVSLDEVQVAAMVVALAGRGLADRARGGRARPPVRDGVLKRLEPLEQAPLPGPDSVPGGQDRDLVRRGRFLPWRPLGRPGGRPSAGCG
jgi:hypothetical protein